MIPTDGMEVRPHCNCVSCVPRSTQSPDALSCLQHWHASLTADVVVQVAHWCPGASQRSMIYFIAARVGTGMITPGIGPLRRPH